MTRGRPIIAFIATVYILAAVRAVIPGLCQTQRVAVENMRNASCCGGETCAPGHDEGPVARERAKPHPPCPFCFLSGTPREALERLALPFTPIRVVAVPLLHPPAPHLPLFPLTDLGRSPPAQIPS